MNDCWNSIGVRGDASCPALQQYVHCRNCPVYAEAALELLHGDLPAGYSADWTAHYAASKKNGDEQTRPFVMCRIGAEWLGLPAHVVHEIAGLRPIHSLPHRRGGAVLGLVNIRGELVACVALGRVLNILASGAPADGAAPRAAHQRLLVLRLDQTRTVCPVDEVDGIHRFLSSELKEIPATVAKSTTLHSSAVAAWRDRSVGLIDDQLLFRSLRRSLA